MTPIGYAALARATLFTPAIDMAENGEGSSSAYSLRLCTEANNDQPILTSLKTSHGDSTITLVRTNSQTIQGEYGSRNVAFQPMIDATTGTLALVQYVALEHPMMTMPRVSIQSGLQPVL